MMRNEQAKAAQIVSPSAYPQFASDIAAMQALIQSGQYGSLTQVTSNPPHPSGSAEVARSTWEFGKAKRCYDTEIAQVGWQRQIIGWRAVSCLS